MVADDGRDADFNGDGLTDVQDFNIWLANRSASEGTSQVPEPGGLLLAGLAGLAITQGRKGQL